VIGKELNKLNGGKLGGENYGRSKKRDW